MKFLSLTTLLLSAALVNCLHPEVHESEKEFEDEFHKEYKNKDDEKKAAQALSDAEKQMNDENSKYDEGKANYFEKLDADSDLPKDKFEQEKEGYIADVTTIRGMGDIMVPEEERFTDDSLLELYERDDPPATWNSVEKNWVTRAKNQGQCGSCAAFSATAVHESCMLKAGAKMEGLDLAEQYLIDCGYNPNDCRNGCNGANTGRYITYYAGSMGGSSPHEYDYVYLNKNPKLVCPTDVAPRNFGYKVSEAKVDNQCSEDRLKTLISTYGAVSVSIYASDSSFNNYAGGVYDGCTSTSTNHAVTAVGYGTENGVDYWLIKNSWGTGWGLNGYIKMKRGVGMCGIGRNGYAAVCTQTTGDLSSIPGPPASSDCKMSGFSQTGTYGWRFNGQVVWVDCVEGRCKPPAGSTSPNACIAICGELNCP